MRIDARKDAASKHAEARLDGKTLRRCIWADDQAGEAEVYIETMDGKLPLCRNPQTGEAFIPTQVVRGCITIVLSGTTVAV